MKVYFGPIDYNVEDGEVFKFEGIEYDYVLELTNEGFKIRDTLNRFVPFSHEDVEPLIRALKTVRRVSRILHTAARIEENLNGNGECCV